MIEYEHTRYYTLLETMLLATGATPLPDDTTPIVNPGGNCIG